MDKNKGHIDAKEFFRLLDADTNQHSNLDEFDLEALEGWKLVKDRAKAKEITDSNVDKKLEELLAEDKEVSPLLTGDHPGKKRSKPGTYILSIAASLVLLFGLFFVFKGFNKQADMAENKEVTGTSGKDMSSPAPPLEEKLKETNSDGSIVTEKGPEYKADVNKPVPIEQEIAAKKQAEYFSYNTDDADTMRVNPTANAEVAELELQTVVTEEKNLDYRKADEQKFKTGDSKGKTTEATKNTGKKDNVAQAQFEVDGTSDIALADKSKVKKEEDREENKKVKSRAVLKKQPANEGYVAAGAPPAVNDQKAPVQMAMDSMSPKTSVATATGATTLTQNENVTLTTPGGNLNTYNWTNANGETKPAIEAEFNGGKIALDAYIKQNLKIPESWKSEEVIVVKFHVDEKGAVSKPKIMSKTGNCPDCEKEAIRFVKAMPAWIAAKKQDGKEISSYKTITLSFKK